MAREILIAESVAELKQLLADGKIPEIGQIALSMNGMNWRCIDHTEENGVVLMMAWAYDWRPFARPNKEHPWGSNDYADSQIRKELNSEVLANLFIDERHQLEYWYPGMGKLFLLSAEEVGYEQTDKTFAWFRGSEEEVREKRKMLDRDGDPAPWWLRSPYPGDAYYVRLVTSDGSLGGNPAYYGYGAVAACVITQQSY